MKQRNDALIEHYAGAFPLWLAPVQAKIIPIADRHVEYVRGVEKKLQAQCFRVQVDSRNERMNAKIRDAQLMKNRTVFLCDCERRFESDAVGGVCCDGEAVGGE